MDYSIFHQKVQLDFRFSARTSRGVLENKFSWYIFIRDHHGVEGIGECAPLPGLSLEDGPDFEGKLEETLERVRLRGKINVQLLKDLPALVPVGYSSLIFGLETAILDYLNGGKKIIFDNEFIRGRKIPINGLVWMGDEAFMRSQVKEKIRNGFSTLKLKIGGIDFDRECSILQGIRKRFSPAKLILRLDANGSFSQPEALAKLKTLSAYHIHSIEQPLEPGHSFLPELCKMSSIPIALDEELIGKREGKEEWLKFIHPSYLILKPTLHGGLYGCKEWIGLAQKLQIGWWMTSALESNIGLNAICQFTVQYPILTTHGLGTGMLFKNNIPSPLEVSRGEIRYDPSKGWGDLFLDSRIPPSPGIP